MEINMKKPVKIIILASTLLLIGIIALFAISLPPEPDLPLLQVMPFYHNGETRSIGLSWQGEETSYPKRHGFAPISHQDKHGTSFIVGLKNASSDPLFYMRHNDYRWSLWSGRVGDATRLSIVIDDQPAVAIDATTEGLETFPVDRPLFEEFVNAQQQITFSLYLQRRLINVFVVDGDNLTIFKQQMQRLLDTGDAP
jgi:hypothetical protein